MKKTIEEMTIDGVQCYVVSKQVWDLMIKEANAGHYEVKESIKHGFVNIVSFPGGLPIVFGDFEEKGKFGHKQ